MPIIGITEINKSKVLKKGFWKYLSNLLRCMINKACFEQSIQKQTLKYLHQPD